MQPRGYEVDKLGDDGSAIGKTAINEATGMVQAGTTGTSPEGGFRINGTKYMIVRKSNDGGWTMYGKRPKGGMCCCATAQCIIVGTFDEAKGQSGGQCNLAVEALGDYLKSVGY